MWDNSDIKQKIRIRNSIFKHPVNRGVCIEYFAGTGQLTDMFWSKVVSKVICIDLDDNKLAQIKAKNVILKTGNNNDFIELSETIEIIDCDAYGLVTEFIRQILEVSKTQKKLVFFTDGYFKVEKKIKNIKTKFKDLINELQPDSYHYEKANGGNVYYGYLYYEKLF